MDTSPEISKLSSYAIKTYGTHSNVSNSAKYIKNNKYAVLLAMPYSHSRYYKRRQINITKFHKFLYDRNISDSWLN